MSATRFNTRYESISVSKSATLTVQAQQQQPSRSSSPPPQQQPARVWGSRFVDWLNASILLSTACLLFVGYKSECMNLQWFRTNNDIFTQSNSIFVIHQEHPVPKLSCEARMKALDAMLMLSNNINSMNASVSLRPPKQNFDNDQGGGFRRYDNETKENLNRVGNLPLVGYQSQEEMDGRSSRFPSVDERVRVYMSNWYVPPCPCNDISTIPVERVVSESDDDDDVPDHFLLQELPRPRSDTRRIFRIGGKVILNTVFYVNRREMKKCEYSYCRTEEEVLLPLLEWMDSSSSSSSSSTASSSWPPSIPPLLQFGDSDVIRAHDITKNKNDPRPNIPILKKFRFGHTREEIQMMTNKLCNDERQYLPRLPNDGNKRRFQPIIWKQKFKRHFGMLDKLHRMDIPWNQKRNMAMFRGELTGVRGPQGLRVEEIETLTPTDMCMKIPRCRLVYMHSNSTYVDAKLTGDKSKIIPDILDGIELWGNRRRYNRIMENKIIIMPEGNDVSTGLKWALFSNSVVIIPKPTKTAWAMEELLDEWIHYIPVRNDYNDLEEKIQWVINNDAKAQEIAHRGSLWIRDLIFHPQAEIDEELIKNEIIRRSRMHFSYDAYINHTLIPEREEERQQQQQEKSSNNNNTNNKDDDEV